MKKKQPNIEEKQTKKEGETFSTHYRRSESCHKANGNDWLNQSTIHLGNQSHGTPMILMTTLCYMASTSATRNTICSVTTSLDSRQ